MLAGLVLYATAIIAASDSEVVVSHVKVFYEQGRFGGWPANHGAWNWGDEILVGFSRGYYKDLGDERHNIDREKPEEHLLARSLDGGVTWTIEDPSKKGDLIPVGRALHGTELPGVEIPEPKPCPGGINFKHPDFAMTVRMMDKDGGASRFYYSYNRGHDWEGPFLLPHFGTYGVSARTDYIVESKDRCTLFLTAAKSAGDEGRPFCARTEDGGKTWSFISWIGPEPEGYAIMPATVHYGGGYLTLIRRKDGDKSWLASFRSEDDGKTWKEMPIAVEDTGEGNPATLTLLRDGRILATYGVRRAPYRMCAKVTGDNGETWSREYVLRDDGGNRDMGYPRAIQRPDGMVVTMYYMWDKETGPERYIAATIFDPAKIK